MTRRHVTALARLFVRACRDDHGGETMEYAMILGMLSLAGYAAARVFGTKITDLWTRVDAALSAF
jgi:Flp pilus assembly pilin Flp